MDKQKFKNFQHRRRKRRVRKKVNGGADRPRLTVFRSLRHIYAQLIDDDNSVTLMSVSTLNKEVTDQCKKGTGNMMCTVGIGGKRSGLLKSAEACQTVIVIDGCPVNCAKATMEEAGIPYSKHILLTDLDIKKNKELDLDPEQLREVLSRVEEMLKSI